MGLNNNSSRDTYSNAGGLSVNDIIDGNIRDLKIKFGIDNIPIENHQLPNLYWMPKKMHKNPIKARFIIASPKCSIKPQTYNVNFSFVFLDKYKHIMICVGFLQLSTLFG